MSIDDNAEEARADGKHFAEHGVLFFNDHLRQVSSGSKLFAFMLGYNEKAEELRTAAKEPHTLDWPQSVTADEIRDDDRRARKAANNEPRLLSYMRAEEINEADIPY